MNPPQLLLIDSPTYHPHPCHLTSSIMLLAAAWSATTATSSRPASDATVTFQSQARSQTMMGALVSAGHPACGTFDRLAGVSTTTALSAVVRPQQQRNERASDDLAAQQDLHLSLVVSISSPFISFLYPLEPEPRTKKTPGLRARARAAHCSLG